MTSPSQQTPPVWLRDFEEFQSSGKWSVAAHRQKLLDQGKELCAYERVRTSPLDTKVQFLLSRDLNLREIEAIIAGTGSLEDSVAFLTKFEKFLSVEEEEGKKKPMSEMPPPRKAATARVVGSATALWRKGMTVYACEDPLVGHYFPVPLLHYDESRGCDHFQVSFLHADGTVAPPRFLVEGSKGCVADSFPSIEVLHQNMEVIGAVDNPFRGHYEEYFITAVKTATETVDLEHVKTGQIKRDVPLCEIRTYDHPAILERRRLEKLSTSNQTTDRVLSASTFHMAGVRERGGNGVMTAATLEERRSMGGQLSSYQSYAEVSREQSPEIGRTYANYIDHYGEGMGNMRTMPRHPVECTFGLPGLHCIQPVEGHTPLLRYNPILEIAAQCSAANQMFIDAEFPPSMYSLYGDTGMEPLPPIQWRRASEIVKASSTIGPRNPQSFVLTPGLFTPSWLCPLLYRVITLTEFEECISPERDGHLYGAYVARVFLDSQWCYLCVDDFFPYNVDTKCFVSLLSSTPTELYCMILEKVLAKLAGSYAALRLQPQTEFVNLRKAWDYFTAGHSRKVSLKLLPKRNDLAGNIEEVLRRESNQCLLCPQVTHPNSIPQSSLLSSLGLSTGDYCVISHTFRSQSSSGELFLHIANPCRPPGDAAMYQQLLKGVSAETLAHMNQKIAASPFSSVHGVWLTVPLFTELFDSLYMLRSFSNMQKGSIGDSFRSFGGGSIFDKTLNFTDNPQFYLNLPQSSEITIELRLVSKTKPQLATKGGNRRHALRLHMHLFPASGFEEKIAPGNLPEDVRSSDLVDLVDDEDALQYPAVLLTAHLALGSYIVIPDVGIPHSDERFVLRVFSEYSFLVKPLL